MDVPALHYPGYNYLGPGTRDFTKRPINALDAAARRHDLAYGRYIDAGIPAWKVYAQYNEADGIFLREIASLDFGAPSDVARNIFTQKRNWAATMTELMRVPAGINIYNGRIAAGLPVVSLVSGAVYEPRPQIHIPAVGRVSHHGTAHAHAVVPDPDMVTPKKRKLVVAPQPQPFLKHVKVGGFSTVDKIILIGGGLVALAIAPEMAVAAAEAYAEGEIVGGVAGIVYDALEEVLVHPHLD